MDGDAADQKPINQRKKGEALLLFILQSISKISPER